MFEKMNLKLNERRIGELIQVNGGIGEHLIN